MPTPPTQATAREVEFLGSRARILVDGDESDGRLGLVEMLDKPPGLMPPLHVHHRDDEGFYVLDGELTLFQPGAEVTLGSGDFFLARQGIPHTYRVGDSGARCLVSSTPAGFERFVVAVAALEGEPDPEVLTALAADHEIEILGPPGTLPDAPPA
jgi:mannose-6-phosphate isomerase-like protein (cupin superfamily)